MYIATVFLNRTEEQFWKMTLKKLMALYDEYKLANGLQEQEKEKVGFIDQIPI